jgi:hypothetical protein
VTRDEVRLDVLVRAVFEQAAFGGDRADRLRFADAEIADRLLQRGRVAPVVGDAHEGGIEPVKRRARREERGQRALTERGAAPVDVEHRDGDAALREPFGMVATQEQQRIPAVSRGPARDVEEVQRPHALDAHGLRGRCVRERRRDAIRQQPRHVLQEPRHACAPLRLVSELRRSRRKLLLARRHGKRRMRDVDHRQREPRVAHRKADARQPRRPRVLLRRRHLRALRAWCRCSHDPS